jgi:hypothetical protein
MSDIVLQDAVSITSAAEAATGNYADNLVVARDNTAALLAQITASPKPSYTVHGHSVSWTEYQRMLREQISGLNQLIAEANPFEFMSQAIT